MELKIDNNTMENLVRTEVQTRITELLAKNSQVLIKEVVRKAFEETKKDAYGYGRETVIENILNKMIREEAENAMKEWIETVRPEIKKQMVARLSDKKEGLAAKIADTLTTGLAGNLQLSVYLKEKS